MVGQFFKQDDQLAQLASTRVCISVSLDVTYIVSYGCAFQIGSEKPRCIHSSIDGSETKSYLDVFRTIF